MTGLVGLPVDHVFTVAGSYTVKLTATDKDSGTSLVAQQVITIKAVDLQGRTVALKGEGRYHSVADIARQLGRSETAVGGLLRRGMTRLRETLQS